MPRLRDDLEFGKMYGGLEFRLWNKDLLGKKVTVRAQLYVFQIQTTWYRIQEDSHTISAEMLIH